MADLRTMSFVVVPDDARVVARIFKRADRGYEDFPSVEVTGADKRTLLMCVNDRLLLNVTLVSLLSNESQLPRLVGNRLYKVSLHRNMTRHKQRTQTYVVVISSVVDDGLELEFLARCDLVRRR
jgi:hypothetical protein